MSAFHNEDGKLDATRLGMALQELEAGTLDPVSRDELMALVAHSPAAQRAYLEYFETTAMLEAEGATFVEQGRLPQVPDFGAPIRLLRRSVMAAAALIFVGAMAALLIKVSDPQIPELALAATAESLWVVEGVIRDADDNGARVREGASVRVKSGTLELRMESGAAMVVQGPAYVSFPKLTEPVVRSGWLWIDSGASRETFEVRTPDLRIRNLGTRFGVRVTQDGPTEVHLINGELELYRDSAPGTALSISADGKGMAFTELGEPSSLDLARDPFPEIAEHLAAQASYPTVVSGQNPAGYWRMDAAANGLLANEVSGGLAGRIVAGVSMEGEGPGPLDGFRGFPDGNQAGIFFGKSTGPAISLGSAPWWEGLLVRDRFDGTGTLNRRKAEESPTEAAWVAGPSFTADGMITGGRGSATLPFEPMDGMVYTLQAELRDVHTPPGSKAWVALGFSSGQSVSGTGARFIDGAVVGRAWMLFHGEGADRSNVTQLSGTSSTKPWRDWISGHGGDVDLRIVLDTTGGPHQWTATWFARRPGDKDFIKVRDRERLPNEGIDSIGIAQHGDEIRARIAGISLHGESATAVEPAPLLADGPSPLNRRAGSVSCWLRWNPENREPQIVWSAGAHPADDAMHIRIEGDGRVGFFIENGRYDLLLTSENTLVEDRWHHLAVSWGSHAAILYLDGQRIAGQGEFLGLPQSRLADFRVGGGPIRPHIAGATSFSGRIDEIAIWTRALTPIEIKQQVRSARREP